MSTTDEGSAKKIAGCYGLKMSCKTSACAATGRKEAEKPEGMAIVEDKGEVQ